MKKQSFVCYARVTATGVQRVLYKAAITPGDDAISKNDATNRTAAAFSTYLEGVVENNTLFPVVEMLASAKTAVETLVASMISGLVPGQRNRIKVGFTKITSGADANKPAFIITVVTNGVKTSTVLPLIA